MSEPKNYRNISEDWGDRCIVTEDDVRAQAEIYGVEDARITVRNDGIYCDGELIAEAIQQEEK